MENKDSFALSSKFGIPFRGFKNKSKSPFFIFTYKNGFTLIEILIVLAILGTIAVVGMRKLNKSENLKTTVRRLTAVIKKSRSYAKLNNQTYRLVIQVDEKTQSFWVEGSNKPIFLDPSKEHENKKKTDKKEKDGPSDGFSPAKEILKKPSELPAGWFFTDIQSEAQKQGSIEGTHYIYFLPQGIAEEAVIQISNKKTTTWTLYIPPHSTQTKIFLEAKNLKDLQE